MIEEMKTTFSLSYACLANQAGLSYRTLMRWKDRLANGLPAVGKRGPKKVRPLDLAELKAKIRDLDHGSKRSRGTGQASRRLRRGHIPPGIECAGYSRHAVKAMTVGKPKPVGSAGFGRTWPGPWTIAKRAISTASGTLHLHNLTDLCSRYKLPPIASGVCLAAKRLPVIWPIFLTASALRCSANVITVAI